MAPSKVKADPQSKGKAKASAIGAPAQYSNTSRKGKKAWRKNIDISEAEVAMEKAREQERIAGPSNGAASGNSLFTIDTLGDASVKKRAPRKLRSLEILSQRSAVPALHSKATASKSPSVAKIKVSYADKERLLRIARKSKVDTAGVGLGSAVLSKGKHDEELRDVWLEKEQEEARQRAKMQEWVDLDSQKHKPLQAPVSLQRRRAIQSATAELKAVPIPDAGISYNPKLENYQALLDAAIAEETALQGEEEQSRVALEKYANAIANRKEMATSQRNDTTYGGMLLAGGDPAEPEEAEEEHSDEEERGESSVRKQKRKTQAQRNKTKKTAELKRAAIQAAQHKKQKESMQTLARLKKSLETSEKERRDNQASRQAERLRREMEGIAPGAKVGKHKVAKKSVEVQLGQDLSENIREIKPEGNLFRDRFHELQTRAMVEPRIRQLPKKRTTKIIEYEKHPWKRFE